MAIVASATIAGLGWLVSPIISEFVKKCISYLGRDMTKEVEDLETILLPQIQLTIEAAQRSSDDHKALLAGWMVRLKNAYFDAESILHELEYEHLKKEAQGEATSLSTSTRDWITEKVSSYMSSQKKKLLKRVNKLKKVVAEAKTFRELLDIQNTGSKDVDHNSRSITSLMLTDKVFGRDGDRDEIIKFLLDEQGDSSLRKSYSVVAITGMGGAGKTTLAQYVCDDEKVKNHFPAIIWLSLSQNLDITDRTKEMIECVSGNRPDLHNLTKLQEHLIKSLPDHVLVVLDDIWYDNNNRIARENQWENILKPFIKFTSRGGTCKIMVNSRSSLFPNALKPEKLIELRDLARDDFISLLRYHAIDNSQISNPQLKKDLSDIVEQIAEKMCKLPLAAKVVGNQLCPRPDITFWRATLEKVDLSDIMEILLWSFHRFDVQLQRCFLFCCVYPKHEKFGCLHRLVPYWVALDFIRPSDDNRNVEDIGSEYTEIMVKNSIFHLVDKKYIMHDLFHDLAEKLSGGDCFKVTNNVEREIPSTVQHVYLRANNKNLKESLSNICHLDNLRTLILGNLDVDDSSEIISEISTNFKNLRVLEVQFRSCKTLPTIVGNLKNLRFLGFSMTSIEELPDSVTQLYHLQFLYLPSSVKAFPAKLSNLIKLRYIEMYNIDNYDRANTLPPLPYLGKLTSLQHLDQFHVKKEEGYKLKQLGPLKEIGSSLKIVNLENVKDKDEAIEARLIDKPKLKNLVLVWTESAENINGSEIAENNSEVEIIEALRPPKYLELLTIVGYRGTTYPTWMKEGSFRENIKYVRFSNCNGLTNLPNFDQFRYYSRLDFNNLGALTELSTFRENLAVLAIDKCPCLIFVCENELQVNENQSIMRDRILRKCVGGFKDALVHELKSFKITCSIENCADQLKILENAAQSNAPQLEKDENVNRAWLHCHRQRMKFIFSTQAKKLELSSKLSILDLGYCCVSDGALSDCLTKIATLEKLYLSGIMTITTLPPEEVLASLQSLRVVVVKDCWYLISLGGLHALPRLQHFLMERCWCLEIESGDTSRMLPLTLQSFIIRTCAVPKAIFNGHLENLQDIEISDCFTSSSLSFDHLTLLKLLALVNCPNLEIIQGLESCPAISTLVLIDLPKLDVESVLKSWQDCRSKLCISNSMMLNKILSTQDFVPPQHLSLVHCDEEEISFVESDHLQSIKKLIFLNCKIERLPKTLSDFSTIQCIHFKNCPNISGLPELPGSIQHILIRGCPVLRERCQPNGPDWHKIQHIKIREIE